MITKGFFLTKENNRIGAIILRDHQILKATAAAKRFQGGQPPREDDAYALAALSPDSQAVHFHGVPGPLGKRVREAVAEVVRWRRAGRRTRSSPRSKTSQIADLHIRLADPAVPG